ncbi:Histone-lysine N-methyltransferase [Handroanthus impetiginosus]|uniref:Histone-lysine N-methyltransferase n=1 Tax=Handroanthus impetiginosus TaxID=429701 RepID=A0A2G9I0L6_9LAMI|nr:Histone-lysine N-methyltransferase [Handroanthus impetiginosus]
MEKPWQSKCGLMWQQFPPPVASSSHGFHAQFSSADCHPYLQPPQEAMSLTPGLIQEHMVPNILGLDNMGHADLGASFLSLLSGPVAHVPCDLKQLWDPKPVPTSSQVPLNNRTVNDCSAGSRVSVLPSALWPHNMDCQNMTSAEVLFPLTWSNSAVSCGNKSAVLEATNLNLQKSPAVSCQDSHEKDKVKSFSYLLGNNNVSPISANNWKHQKYADMTALQKFPVERNLSASHHGHNPYCSLPRVFCSGTSGNLLLSDMGLLGVVCACHGLYMSISKFSEHSGSCNVNPGNAVRMDNGESIVHWWETFLSKSGIRVLEGHRGWDWPGGISAASGFTNRPISNMSSNAAPLDQACPFRTSVSHEQRQYRVINSKENQSSRDIFDEYPYNEKDRTCQEYGNSLFKHFINTSRENLQHVADQHILEMPNSFGINTENASLSATAKLDSVSGTSNSLLALPNIEDPNTPQNGLDVGRNTSFIVERPGVSSNTELRLGQLLEQGQALEANILPAFGCNPNGMHVERTKGLFSDKLLQRRNELQRSNWSLQYADTASNPTKRRGSTQVEHRSDAGGAYGAVTDYRKDSSNSNWGMTDQNLPLLSCFRNPETKWQFRNTYDNGSGSHVSEKLQYESHASKSEKNCFPWSRGAGKIKEFDANLPNTQNHLNKGKELECAVNGLLGAGKSNNEFGKTVKEGPGSFNVALGQSSFNHSLAFHEKSLNLCQMPAMIVDESPSRDILNDCWKISSLFDTGHFNHDHVKPIQSLMNSTETISMGFTSRSSVFVQSVTPILSEEKCSGISPGLQDENMKMPAVQNMLELSDRDDGLTSVRNIQECEILKNPCAESLLTITPSILKDHIHLLDPSRMLKIPEVGEKLMSPGTVRCTGHNSERFGTMTDSMKLHNFSSFPPGRSLPPADCDLPPVEQLFLRPGGIECNFMHSKKEQCSQGLPYAFVQENCSCIVQANCLTGNHNSNGDNCYNFVRQRDRSGASATVFHSELNENCIFLKERAESFEGAENLVMPNIKGVESPSNRWRNVPTRIMESCSSTRKQQQAGSFNASLGSPAADVAKCFSKFAPNFLPLKDHEISNISSGCSAPDVTQSSIEVNKKDSSTVEGGDFRCASNPVLDEGSGNDGSWSSDDALYNEHCAEFSGAASRINLIKREPFKVVPRKPSLSLIEEIRLQNSLRCKNAPYQIKRSSTIQEESDRLRKFDVGSKKRRKTVKWMKLDEQCPVSGQSFVNKKSPKCIEEVGQNANAFWYKQMQVGCDRGSPSNCADSVEQSFKQMNSAFSAAEGISLRRVSHKVYHQGEQQTTEAYKSSRADNALEASEVVRQKRLRIDYSSATSNGILDTYCSGAELASKLTSLGCLSNSLGKPNLYKWMAKPIVSGKYGIISNGNPSKPTKIIPLMKVLKTEASHAKRSSTYDKLKSASVKVKKTSIRHVKETPFSEKILESQARKSGNHNMLPIELEPHDLNKEIETASCSATNRREDLSRASQKCNNQGIAGCKPGYQLKTKLKEGRKRSLHELLTAENAFEVVNSAVMKSPISLCQTTRRYWGELMEDAADGRGQTYSMNNTKRYSEKQQPGDSDTFCCVCGSLDKDEHNQLRECIEFLDKGLRSEPEAVDNENVSFCGRCMSCATPCLFITDGDGGDNKGLQPGEKFWTCARTEGYKGRKREGLLHNYHQDANGTAGCLVPQEQLNAWLHIHRQKPQRKGHPKLSSSSVESDCRKAYARYKQSKGWKHLVVYKSGIHALGLYTSQFISRGAMVVEYVGEIVGLRVADRRESEYHSGKKLQHKSACYFFRIDKEHIIDATRKGGIARFVNHSCQPNCVAKVISVRNEKKVVFFAERDIYPGEEITYDYHFNHEDEGEKIPCYCNSKNCRRYLN